jgi:hypothetical protein
MSKFTITIKTEGEDTTHITSGGAGGNYGSLCGVSIDDDEKCGRISETQKPKVDCTTCIQIWTHCRAVPARVIGAKP